MGKVPTYHGKIDHNKRLRKCFFSSSGQCNGQSLKKCACGVKYCEAHRPGPRRPCKKCRQDDKEANARGTQYA